VAVRPTRLSNRLSNQLYNRFDNRLYRVWVYHHCDCWLTVHVRGCTGTTVNIRNLIRFLCSPVTALCRFQCVVARRCASYECRLVNAVSNHESFSQLACVVYAFRGDVDNLPRLPWGFPPRSNIKVIRLGYRYGFYGPINASVYCESLTERQHWDTANSTIRVHMYLSVCYRMQCHALHRPGLSAASRMVCVLITVQKTSITKK